jgi:hypothetical protein
VYFSRRNRYWAFFGVTALLALSMSLGGYTGLYRLYFNYLPGVNKFRAPSISLFLVSMSLVIMAALTLEALSKVREKAPEEEKAAKRAAKGVKVRTESDLSRYFAIGIIGIGVLLILVSQTIPSPVGESLGWIRFGLFLTIVGWLLWRWLADRLSSRTLALILAVVVLLDQWIVTRKFFQTVEPPDVVFAPDDVVQFLRSQQGDGRVWVFPFGGQAVYHGVDQVGENRIPLRNYLMHFGFEQAGGEHGNQLERFNKYAGAGEKVYVDWHNFTGWPVFMSAANIRYIVSGLELQMFDSTGTVEKPIEEVYRGATAIVYRNNLALPRAYLASETRVIPDTDGALNFMKMRGWNPRQVAVVDRPIGVDLPATPLTGTAEIVEKSPDKVVVRTTADRPAFLVLADVYAHGWKAWVDDSATPIAITNVAFRGVPVGAGTHTVRFEFDPDALRTGRTISLILFVMLLAYGAWWLLTWRRNNREMQAA